MHVSLRVGNDERLHCGHEKRQHTCASHGCRFVPAEHPCPRDMSPNRIDLFQGLVQLHVDLGQP